MLNEEVGVFQRTHREVVYYYRETLKPVSLSIPSHQKENISPDISEYNLPPAMGLCIVKREWICCKCQPCCIIYFHLHVGLNSSLS